MRLASHISHRVGNNRIYNPGEMIPSSGNNKQQEPRRFSVQDGIDSAYTELKEMAQEGKIVLNHVLEAFRQCELCTYFLHALVAYIFKFVGHLRLTQDTSLDGPVLEVLLLDFNEDQQRKSLRRLARYYSRVLLYCSNFERTYADAAFFESLLLFCRLLCHLAVNDEAYGEAIDSELSNLFRGGVFSPQPWQPKRPAGPQGSRDNSPKDAALKTGLFDKKKVSLISEWCTSCKDELAGTREAQVALPFAPCERRKSKKGSKASSGSKRESSKPKRSLREAALCNISVSENFRLAMSDRLRKIRAPRVGLQHELVLGRPKMQASTSGVPHTSQSLPCVIGFSAPSFKLHERSGAIGSLIGRRRRSRKVGFSSGSVFQESTQSSFGLHEGYSQSSGPTANVTVHGTDSHFTPVAPL
ncbi:unnamed protein product [Chrysoparadoxa australica]